MDQTTIERLVAQAKTQLDLVRVPGERLRKRRQALQFTHAHVGAIAQLTPWELRCMERGHIHDIERETLRRLARALRVTSDFLLEIEDSENEDNPAAVALVGA